MQKLLLFLFVLLSFTSRGQITTTKYRDTIYTKIGMVNAPGTITRLTMAKCWLYLADISDSSMAQTRRYADSLFSVIPIIDTSSLSARIDAKQNRADTNSAGNPVTVTYGLNNYIIKGGQVAGTQLQYGTSDSVGLTSLVYGQVQDSISAANGVHYMKGKYNSESVLILKNKVVRNGADQTRGLIMGIGNGNTVSSNLPFIQFGTALSNTNPMFYQGGLHHDAILFRSASSANNPMVIYGVGSGTATNYSAISFALGGYAGGAALTPTSGVINNIELGRPSSASGTFAPTSGIAQKHAVNDISVINQTGSATGITSSFTNRSIALTGAYDYRGVYFTNNIGHAFFSEGTAPNHLVGRTTIGTITDNTVDALQVLGDAILTTAGNKLKIATGTNASTGTGTLSGGTVTISTTAVTASSLIFVTLTSCTSCGHVYISAKVAATSFTLTSTDASDASTFNYWIIN